MKDFEIQAPEQIEIKAEAKKNIDKVLIGSIKPHKNHKVFEYNYIEDTLQVAQFDKRIDLNPFETQINKSISKKKDCVYVSEMNKKNAIKKLNALIKKP